jgi:hypothetical protein
LAELIAQPEIKNSSDDQITNFAVGYIFATTVKTRGSNLAKLRTSIKEK